MKAQELKTGDEFKLPGQRKFRKIAYINELQKGKCHPDHVGRLLICTSECKQMLLEKEAEAILNVSGS